MRKVLDIKRCRNNSVAKQPYEQRTELELDVLKERVRSATGDEWATGDDARQE